MIGTKMDAETRIFSLFPTAIVPLAPVSVPKSKLQISLETKIADIVNSASAKKVTPFKSIYENLYRGR